MSECDKYAHMKLTFWDSVELTREEGTGCRIQIRREKLEVKIFQYLGAISCKHVRMEGEIEEKTVQGRRVIKELKSIMKKKMVVVIVPSTYTLM